MKKLSPVVLTVISLLFFTNTYSQLAKGEKMLGATFSLSSNKVESENFQQQKGFQFSVIPQLGFGLGKNWIVGVAAGYVHGKIEQSGEEEKANAFSVGTFLRKFYGFGDKFGIFGQLSLAAAFGKGERTGSIEYDTDITTISAVVQPGFYFRPTNRIILEAVFGNIGYTYTETEYSPGIAADTKRNAFQFSVTEALAFGFKVVL